jgi:hypothetical protein
MIADCQLPIANWLIHMHKMLSQIGNRQLAIGDKLGA